MRNADHHISEETDSRLAGHFAGAFHFFGSLALLQVFQVFQVGRFDAKMDAVASGLFECLQYFRVDGVNPGGNFKMYFNTPLNN